VIAAFVADASLAIAWVHPAQATSESGRWLARMAAGADLVVPGIWPLEVSNALLSLERRRKLTRPERQQALALLRALQITTDHEGAGRAFAELTELATTESLSVYDASYLELAMRRQLPLACKDGPLRTAAERNGVQINPS
jgi:predicted nucleic acid-binding protein